MFRFSHQFFVQNVNRALIVSILVAWMENSGHFQPNYKEPLLRRASKQLRRSGYKRVYAKLLRPELAP